MLTRSEDRAGVEDAFGVEGVLDAAGQGHDVGADLVGQPCLFQAADAVFAGYALAETKQSAARMRKSR